MTSKPNNSTKYLRYAALAGTAIGFSVLIWSLTRSRTNLKSKNKNNTTRNKPKGKKIKYQFTKRPLTLHFVMGDEDGFGAYIGANKEINKDREDKNNPSPPIGSQLTKIGNKKCDNWTYQQIQAELNALKKSTTLEFRTNKEFNILWTEAQNIKAEANKYYVSKDYKNAVSTVTRAISKHPTNVMLYSNRILMLFQSKQYQSALLDCQKIRELDPLENYSKGHHLRGMVLMKLNKYKDAATAFQKVLRLKPNFEKSKTNLEKCLNIINKERKEELDKIQKEREELKKKHPVREDNMDDSFQIVDPNDPNNDDIISKVRARGSFHDKDEEKDFNDHLDAKLKNVDGADDEDEEVPDLV